MISRNSCSKRPKVIHSGPYTPLIFLLSLLMLDSTPSGAQDSNLELRLNSITHAIINPADLGKESIPLQSLFPYLETVEYLEVKSAQSSASWDATSLGSSGWNDALLTFRNQIWELSVGSDSLAAPLRISVHGVRKPIDSVQIWSSIRIPQYKSNLLAALALRGIRVQWKDVSKLTNRLENPPPHGMPHLVIVDQLQMLRLDSLLTSPYRIMAKFSRWYSVPPIDANKLIAIDAYHPESALLYLLADNPNLFDKDNQLPASLTTFFNRIIMSEGLVVSTSPLADLANSASSQVTGAVLLPSSQELEIGEIFAAAEPPADAANIIGYIYAAIPANIDGEQKKLARLVLEDANRLADLRTPANAVAIPGHPRILRFFDAYARIGRLAISNQITATKAAELINSYVVNN